MSDGGAGEHCQVMHTKETWVWNQLNPLRKWGHHWAMGVPVTVSSSSCSSQPRGALAEAFLETQLAHLGEQVASALVLLSTCWFLPTAVPELFSTWQSRDFGVHVRLGSCSPLPMGCCLSQEEMEFLHPGQWQDWPLLQGQIWQVHLAVTRGVPCPRGKCPLAQVGMAHAPGGSWPLPRWKGRISWPPHKNSTIGEIWLVVSGGSCTVRCIYTWLDLSSDCFIFLWLSLECLSFLLFEFVYPAFKLADQPVVLVMASEGVCFELGPLDEDRSFLENPFAGGTSVNTNWNEKYWKKHLIPF